MKLFKASVEVKLWYLYLSLGRYFDDKCEHHENDYLDVACNLRSAFMVFWCKDVHSLVKEIKK